MSASPLPPSAVRLTAVCHRNTSTVHKGPRQGPQKSRAGEGTGDRRAGRWRDSGHSSLPSGPFSPAAPQGRFGTKVTVGLSQQEPRQQTAHLGLSHTSIWSTSWGGRSTHSYGKAGSSLDNPHPTLKTPRQGRTHSLVSLTASLYKVHPRTQKGVRWASCQRSRTLLCPYSHPKEGGATGCGSQAL